LKENKWEVKNQWGYQCRVISGRWRYWSRRDKLEWIFSRKTTVSSKIMPCFLWTRIPT